MKDTQVVAELDLKMREASASHAFRSGFSAPILALDFAVALLLPEQRTRLANYLDMLMIERV